MPAADRRTGFRRLEKVVNGFIASRAGLTMRAQVQDFGSATARRPPGESCGPAAPWTASCHRLREPDRRVLGRQFRELGPGGNGTVADDADRQIGGDVEACLLYLK